MTQIGKAFLEDQEEAVRKAVAEVEKRAAEREAEKIAEVLAKSEERDANMTIRVVDSLSRVEQLPVEEACKKLSISVQDYINARLLVERLRLSAVTR